MQSLLNKAFVTFAVLSNEYPECSFTNLAFKQMKEEDALKQSIFESRMSLDSCLVNGREYKFDSNGQFLITEASCTAEKLHLSNLQYQKDSVLISEYSDVVSDCVRKNFKKDKAKKEGRLKEQIATII